MQNKLFTTILCLILLLTSVPLTTTADENSDDTTDSSLTASQITDFVNEWTNIILHPDSYNLSSLPPEEKYANLTTEDKQVLVETLLSRLENESSEIYQDLHPSNATQQEIHEKYEQLKAFLSSFIFDRENLMHQLENTTQGLTEQYNGSEDTMQNEGNSTIVWGQSDTYEKNLAEIQQVGVENNVDTIINNAVTYESELKNG
ncbi:MAG TPA: hypothetical protein ENI42_05255, partial [Thermoplasmatales archaeon]|nr:hypothetical protein [Thermoplasmatales archaeon]